MYKLMVLNTHGAVLAIPKVQQTVKQGSALNSMGRFATCDLLNYLRVRFGPLNKMRFLKVCALCSFRPAAFVSSLAILLLSSINE
jgi:hypothetical protein